MALARRNARDAMAELLLTGRLAKESARVEDPTVHWGRNQAWGKRGPHSSWKHSLDDLPSSAICACLLVQHYCHDFARARGRQSQNQASAHANARLSSLRSRSGRRACRQGEARIVVPQALNATSVARQAMVFTMALPEVPQRQFQRDTLSIFLPTTADSRKFPKLVVSLPIPLRLRHPQGCALGGVLPSLF